MGVLMLLPDCAPPGTQVVLFHLPFDAVGEFMVLNHHGSAHTTSRALGIVSVVARHLAVVDGHSWVQCLDGTSARVEPGTVASATPEVPWVRSLAHAIPGEAGR